VDNARFFSQGNKMTYDEAVQVETVAKHLADQSHQFTQYSGVRPNGVALIIAGVDMKGESIYLTDPSGTFIKYAAIAIGSGSDEVNSFLEKNYNFDMGLEDAASLAIAAINLKTDEKNGVDHIKMAKVTTKDKVFEKISESDIKNYSQNSSKFSAE
jgi:proteasome alpha subunit